MSDSQHPTEPPFQPPQPPQAPQPPQNPESGQPAAPEVPPAAPGFGYGAPQSSTPEQPGQPQQPAQPTQPYGAPQQQPGQPSPYGAPAQQPGQPSPYGAPGQQAPYGAPGAPTGPGAPAGPGGPGYGAPAYATGGYAPVPKKSNGLAIGSLIAGGAALLLSAIPFFNFFLILVAIAGIIMGIIALAGKKASRGLALAGTIVSAVAVIATIISAVFWTFVFNEATKSIDDTFPSYTVSSEPSDDSSDDATDDGTDTGDAGDINLAFGETVVYDDGLEITVSAPEPFTPGQYAAGNDQAENVVFTITLVNNSTENYDPVFFPSVSSAGTEASSIIDIDSDIELFGPTTTVPPGQSVTWRTAYSVADSTQVVFQISPGFEYDDAVYTS